MSDKKVLSEWENQQDELKWDTKKARRMVWRTRLSLSLTVVRTLLILFLLYILYTIPLQMTYSFSDQQAQFDRAVATLVGTHYSGVQVVKKGVFAEASIEPWLSQHTTLKLYQSVGDWKKSIGEVHAEKWLFGDISYKLDLEQKFLNQKTQYDFAVPLELLGKQGGGPKSKEAESVWNQLENVGDGYVATMAFSTTKGMVPEELRQRLEEYNLRLLQMPVYAGELTDIKKVSYSQAGQFYFLPHLVLRPAVVYDEKNRLSHWYSQLNSPEILDKSAGQLLNDLDWLISNVEYNGEQLDKLRLDYLKENGIKVYGAVVTGPVRELEQLKKEPLYYRFQLGGMEVWNWDRSA